MNNTLRTNSSSNLTKIDCTLPIAYGIALITTNSIVSVLGTLGNLLVCVAVITNPRLRRPSNYLLFSLAIADLLVTMVCEPVMITLLQKRMSSNDCSQGLRIVFVLIASFSSTVSIVHLAAISVERLLAVVYPLRHKDIMESFGLKVMLSVSWILPIIVFILHKFIQLPPAFKPLFTMGVFTLCYAIVLVSYFAIVIDLAKQRKQRKQMSASPSAVNSRLTIRVTFTLAIVIVVFTACWFPLFLVNLFIAFAANAQRPLVKMWIWTVALSNSAMNFLIYGARMRNFGDTYVEIFRKILSYAGVKSRRQRVRPQGEKNVHAPARKGYDTRL